MVKRATDRKVFHIEDVILSMTELNLIVLFDEPTKMNILIDENEKHKKETGKLSQKKKNYYTFDNIHSTNLLAKKLEIRSIAAQKATVELIQLFIEHTNISTTEDKYDFMAFEKIFQHVFVYNEGDHIEPCNVCLLNDLMHID